MIRRFPLLCLLLCCLVLSLASSPASAQQKKVAKPKSQVELVPGNFVQLDVIWIPVSDGGSRPVYQGIFVRLYLSDTERYEGCVKIAYIPEMIILGMADNPISKKDFNDPKKLKSMVESIIMKGTGRRLYRQIEVSLQDIPLTIDEQALSNTCK